MTLYPPSQTVYPPKKPCWWHNIDGVGCLLLALYYVAIYLAFALPYDPGVKTDPEEQRIEQLRREWKPAPYDLSPNDEPQRMVSL